MRFDRGVARSLPLVAALALLVGAGSGTTSGRTLEVGFVTDIVALDARPVPRQVVTALRRAKTQLGVETRVVARGPNESYLPGISYLARARFDLVIGFSFQAAGAIDAVAVEFPRTKFVLVDSPASTLEHRPKNVLGLVFREQEAGYLAGYLAALEERRRPGRDVVSSIGAYPNPPISRFIAGFQAGARKADPGITLLNAFSLNYVDRERCRSLALSQIARGSGAVFAVSGDCGLGALEAAKEQKVWGIGSELDRAVLGPQILTSAVKTTGAAVFDIIRSAQEGRFKGGDLSLGLREGGVRLGRISPKVPRSLVHRLERVRAEIVSGRIRNIPIYPLVP